MPAQPTLLDPFEPRSQSPEPPDPRAVNSPPRVQWARRHQTEFHVAALDDLLPDDHRARLVWAFAEGLDLSALYANIRAVENGPGCAPIDPRILTALWLYATLEGIGSARCLDRLCGESLPYRWLCGGVGVNYHTLSDFRVENIETLNDLLTRGVAAMMAQGLVTLERVAIDGMRVRAAAGAASFRRRPTLEQALGAAREQVERLAKEIDRDPAASNRRAASARVRAARERAERVEAALEQMPRLEEKKTKADKSKARVSTTDAQARVMKMADGGYRPAFNAELATDTQSGIIVAAAVINSTDMGQLAPVVQQIKERYDRPPDDALADGGFAKKDDIDRLAGPEFHCRAFVPVQVAKSERRAAHEPHALDTPAVAQWRQRMATQEAKTIYKQRASSAEWVNAQARNRGLRRLLVRGTQKTLAVLLWHVLTHNMMRSYALRSQATPASG